MLWKLKYKFQTHIAPYADITAMSVSAGIMSGFILCTEVKLRFLMLSRRSATLAVAEALAPRKIKFCDSDSGKQIC